MDPVRLVIVMAALACLDAGCTAEEWREGLLPKRAAEIDARFQRVETTAHDQAQRIDQVEARAADHSQRIDRVEARVASVEVALTETRALASVAAGRSTASSALPTAVTERPGRGSATGAGRTLVGVVHVPFGFDRADLDDRGEMALGSIVKELRGNPKMTIDLEGSTDPTGRPDYNARLSQRRLETVKRWLRANGVDGSRILNSASRGPLLDDSIKDENKRRVTVKLMTRAD
jgi:outer membrane protein OmpA-like peptidoglycan-associated protein